MPRLTFTAVAFLALSAFAQQQPVDVSSEPHHHKVIDNLFVRAYAVQIDPQQATLMHRHSHDYLSVSLGDAAATATKEGGQPTPVKFKDGDVRFSGPLVHEVTDAAPTPFRNITIELLQPTTNQKNCTESCSIAVPCDSADKSKCVSVEKVMTADQWSVTRITIPPGALYPKHTHLANFLVIPLTDSDVKVSVQDGPETEAHDKAGEVRWNNPLIHSVRNAGSAPARVVVLEFRGRPAGEGSESMGPQQKPEEHKPHDHH